MGVISQLCKFTYSLIAGFIYHALQLELQL